MASWHFKSMFWKLSDTIRSLKTVSMKTPKVIISIKIGERFWICGLSLYLHTEIMMNRKKIMTQPIITLAITGVNNA